MCTNAYSVCQLESVNEYQWELGVNRHTPYSFILLQVPLVSSWGLVLMKRSSALSYGPICAVRLKKFFTLFKCLQCNRQIYVQTSTMLKMNGLRMHTVFHSFTVHNANTHTHTHRHIVTLTSMKCPKMLVANICFSPSSVVSSVCLSNPSPVANMCTQRLQSVYQQMKLLLFYLFITRKPSWCWQTRATQKHAKLLQFDVHTTLSLTILAYLHSFSCCCIRNLRNPEKFTEKSNLQSSRSSKVIDLGVNRKPMYDFLLVTH